MWIESARAAAIPAEHRAAGHHEEHDPATDHNSCAHNDDDHTAGTAAGTAARAEATPGA
ncbi:MAG TPA: hypothetical protein VGX25_33690 [Actinophytocola sp.]|uniref:hypothetical protein n=1 Tax=Actinophytocola sp. TaxID=1872138 RepID=UPI002DDDAA82|nr:hypothetical protein [Actinophytocola sp.]HEV2784366.1 hypothetical protein [Actinophytocola sp.]